MTGRKFFSIELELADEPGHAHGDAMHQYRLHLPLTPNGHIDSSAFVDWPEAFRVVRSRRDEPEASGQIRRGPPGQWIFEYDAVFGLEDETSFRLSEARFLPGRFVSVTEDDGITHALEIKSVTSDN